MENITHEIWLHHPKREIIFSWICKMPFRFNVGDKIDLPAIEILSKTKNKEDDLEQLHQDFFDCLFVVDEITIGSNYCISCYLKPE